MDNPEVRLDAFLFTVELMFHVSCQAEMAHVTFRPYTQQDGTLERNTMHSDLLNQWFENSSQIAGKDSYC